MASAAGIRLGKVFVEIGADPSKLFGTLNKLNKRIGSIGQSMTNFGGRMTAIGGALAAPLALASRQFASFDDAIRATAAVTGSLGPQGAAALAMLNDKARELGATTSFTAVQVANLMTELGRAGFNPQEINEMTESVLALARATGTDASLSAGIMAATLRQFAMGAGDAARVADVLTAAANSTFNTVEGLGESLKFAGPVAKSLGMSLEDTVAVLGVLGNVGIQGSEAGTALRRLSVIAAGSGEQLQQLFGISNTDADGNLKPLVNILDEINTVTANMPVAERTEKMAKAFGLLGITSANVLSQSAGGVADLAAKLQSAEGTAAATAKEMDAGLGGAMRIALSAIEGTALAIGDALAPSLQKAIEFVTSMAGRITEFVKNNEELIVSIGQGVAAFIAVGAAITGVGLALSGVSAVLGVALNPLVLMPAAIGLAVAGLISLGDGMSGLASAATQTFGGIYDAITAGDLGMAFEILMAGWNLAWAKGSEALLNGIDYLSHGMYETLAQAFTTVSAVVMGTIDNLVNGVMLAFDNMIAAVRKSWNYVQSFLTRGFDLAAENAKVDNEMAARAQARAVSRPGIAERMERGQAEYEQARAGREETMVAIQGQRAAGSAAAQANLDALTQQAAAKSADVSAASTLQGDLGSVKSMDELGTLGNTLADLLERGNLTADREKQLIDAYNSASEKIGAATAAIESDAAKKADPKAVQDAALAAAAQQSEVVGSFSSVGLGGMGFGGNLQQQQLDTLKEIADNTANMDGAAATE